MSRPGGYGRPARASIAARLLAVLALAAVAIAVIVVIGSSTATQQDARDRGARPGGNERSQQGGGRPPRRYEVEPGDTLSEIADRFGVRERRLRELNPDVDPQALVSGQRLRLR